MTDDNGLHRVMDIEGDLACLADRLCVGMPIKRDMMKKKKRERHDGQHLSFWLEYSDAWL